MRACGFRELRVRFHDAVARVELPVEDLPRLLTPGVRETVVQELQRLGFIYVAVDLQGFRSGSLNDRLPRKHEGPEGFDPPAPRIR